MGRVLHYKIMLKIELGLKENAECQICIRAISAIHAFEDKGGQHDYVARHSIQSITNSLIRSYVTELKPPRFITSSSKAKQWRRFLAGDIEKEGGLLADDVCS
jgi:hypothetical protein